MAHIARCGEPCGAAVHQRGTGVTAFAAAITHGNNNMTQAQARIAQRRNTPVTATHSGVTQVELIWVEKRIEHWLRFGRQAGDQIVDRRRRIVRFAPYAVFAFVRWQANDYGTVRSNIDIVRAVAPGQAYVTLPHVQPGGELLLHIHGWPKVIQVLRLIDGVEALGIDAADAAPDYWRHVHNRLSSGDVARGYSRERHQAWLSRQKLAS